jgi:hypothetical protein
MPSRERHRLAVRLALALALLVVILPAAASAADPAASTITACKADTVTVAGKVALSGAAARRARGAVLQMRFQALALFGLPHSGNWTALGKKLRESGQQTFSGLPADNWIGVLSWRYKKGSRTVLSGDERSQPLRIGGKHGIANCVLAEGAKPIDTTPPVVHIAKTDGNWYRAPAQVQVTASDDFSGVARVQYSLDGGPDTTIGNGNSLTIPTEGVHTLDVTTTDVAGNPGTASGTVRVDAAPPSKPVVTSPPSVTANARPTFSWTASTDTGSGVRGYFVSVKGADGSTPVQQAVDGNTTSLASPVTLADGQTYTVTITAVDNTADQPWTTDSDPYTFRVDSNADASGFNPASGTVLSGNLKSGDFTITLDRPADPATVSSSTVVLDRSDGTDPSYSAGCSNTPCTSITVHPSSALGEGHYTLRLNGVKSAAEGLTFGGSAVYAVPYTESGSIPQASSPTSVLCTDPGVSTTSTTYSVSAADPNQTAFLNFDIAYSGTGGWSMQALYNGTAIGQALEGTAAGHYQLTFPIGGHTGGMLSFKLTAHCSSTTVSASNLFGSRFP